MENLTKKQKLELFNRMYKEGIKDSQIARILGVSEGVINQMRWELNLPAIDSINITDEDFLNIAKEAKTKAEIAKALNISESAVLRRCKRLKVEIKAKKIEERKDEFIELYNSGLSDSDIADVMHYGLKTVQKFRSSLNLERNNNRQKINLDDFMELYNDFKTDSEIADVLNVTQSAVSRFRKDLKLSVNKEINRLVALTNEEYQVLIGGLLGDSSLQKNKAGNITGNFAHCMKQKDYALHKYNILKNFCSPPRIQKMHDERFKVKDYERITVTIRSFENLKDIYNKFYPEGKKVINREVLDSLDGLGLATWFMDDGSNAKYGYILCTNGFSDEDRIIISNYFLEKYNISTTVHKRGEIYIPAKSKETFKNLIEPYIIPSMRYKL
jgi:predicted transcriptional regulator